MKNFPFTNLYWRREKSPLKKQKSSPSPPGHTHTHLPTNSLIRTFLNYSPKIEWTPPPSKFVSSKIDFQTFFAIQLATERTRFTKVNAFFVVEISHLFI